MAIVSVKGLTKSYARVNALRELTFGVNKGEIFGIIGPDGAGKTSLFRILTTLQIADKGFASIAGFNVKDNYKQIRQLIGYMPGRFSLYPDLSVEENLNFFATIFKTSIKENYHLIKDIYCQIEPFKKRKAGNLSGGMKQKLALCCSLIHAPLVLFLDEPTTGVDPVSRKEFWTMLKKLKIEHGLTIIVSTPYMDEAVQCDRIALMQDGKFLYVDSPQNIIASYNGTLWAVRTQDMHRLLYDLHNYNNIETVFSFGETLHAKIKEGSTNTQELVNYLINKGHHNICISPIKATIEDCFMALMKEGGNK